VDDTDKNGTENGNTPTKPRFGKGSGSGARYGNTNGLRHGMRGGKLPKGCRYIENRVNALRRQLEAATIAAKGEINIVDAATINSVLRWERHGMLAAHWLRKEADTLSTSDRLRFSEAIAKAGDNRDRNIRLLGLEQTSEDLYAAFYCQQALPHVSNGEANGGTTDE
jgi:hypothetical protein